MSKLYIICGHGAGDPGACAYGYSEAERVRALGKRIKALGGSNVVLMNTKRNWYADKGVTTYRFPANAEVCELHLDCAGESARGGHVIVKKGLSPDKYDKKIAKFIKDMFPGRSETIVGRGDLANINRAAVRGINYRLVECCFISNASDIAKFNANMDKIAKEFLSAFGMKVSTTDDKKKPKPVAVDKTDRPAGGSKTTKAPFKVEIDIPNLRIRKGPGTKYATTGKYTGVGTFSIVEVKSGAGSKTGWGKLKSGAGWISLDYTKS